MNFTINVQVTGLESIVSLLERLVSVSSAQQSTGAVNLATAVGQTVQQVQPQPVMSLVPPQPQMQQPQQMQPQPVAAVPVMQAPAPAQQFAAPAAPIPLATNPTYSQDQLAVAATQLMDAGRQNDVVGLLATFGVPSLRDLPIEQYGNFATQLRGLGARI